MTGSDWGRTPPSQLSRYDRADLVFLDFEASGLAPGSWPIQIGLARVHEDDSISIDEDLIRPHPTWLEKLWSHASAEVHGIPRSRLETAPEAPEVAAAIIPLLLCRVLVSDAPEYDARWLRMLTSTVDPAWNFQIEDFDGLLARSCDAAGVQRAYATLDALNAFPPPHRAGANAARLAHAWLAGVRG